MAGKFPKLEQVSALRIARATRQSSRGGGESRPAPRSSTSHVAASPEIGTGGGIRSLRTKLRGKKRSAAMRNGGSTAADKLRAPAESQAGVATGPRETKRKAGRPLDSEKDNTLTATRPWKALGMSRRTWYRRQAEKRAKE
mgnify:CR=1 FL=1